jgi:branched-chain amino acid transport system permease protein
VNLYSSLVKAAAAGFVLTLAALAPMLPVYQLELITQMLIYAIFAMSLDILAGYSGLPSLGHAAYFGLAAYATAILWLRLSVPFALAAPAGVAASVIAAALFNLLALRTSRGYYLMITLAFSQLLWSLAVSWTELTGGDNGLPGLERPGVAWFPLSLTPAVGFFYLTLLVFVISTIALWVLVRSPVGYAFKGVRENEGRMRALGYDVWKYKYFASLVAALFAGIAGELFLYLNGFVSPSALSVTASAQVLMMVLVGAAGTMFGPILGAVVFMLLQYVVSSYTERWLFVIGFIYLLIALYAPRGVLTLVADRVRRRARRVA